MALNLLHDVSTRGQIRQILAVHPRRPLLPPLDTEPWKKAARHPLLQSFIKTVCARAIEEATGPLPPLTEELFLIYHHTGSRMEFESVYFERRRRLARAALALLLGDKDERTRLIPSFLDKLTGIFEEIAWAFPAHMKDSSVRDSDMIDLFCAETANLMAEMLDVFGAIIPAELKARILTRLRKKIWSGYLGKRTHSGFWWQKGSNNWNAVCHQGVIGSALAQCDDIEMLTEMLFRMREGLPHFLSGFGPDGGSSEGPGYWDYGFGWFAMLNEQLELHTGGELSLFTGDAHVLEIARFGPRTSFSNGHLVCFSDSPPDSLLRPANLLYLGNRLDDALCHEQGMANYAAAIQEGVDFDFQRSDFFALSRLVLRCPETLPEKTAAPESRDVYLPDLAVIVSVSTDAHGHLWEFAAKGGHNEEHHNHNDCGNFTLNLDGHSFITEIGQPRYTRDFFHPKLRYENLAARTLGHSLPIINGCEQSVGRDYAATVLEYSSTPRETTFIVDLTACYPAAASCRRLVRTFRLDKSAGCLTVRDDFELGEVHDAETAIVTMLPVEVGKESATLDRDGLRLVLHAEEETVITGVQQHSFLRHSASIREPGILHRVVFKPAALSTRFLLGFVAELK